MEDKNLKILTVDDSRLMIPYFNHIFKDMTNVVWVGHAYNIKEAKDLLEREQPNVVFLDICLKDGKGFNLLESIRKRYPRVNVFMLSNNKNRLYIRQSREQGALFLIDKTKEFHMITFFLKALSTAEKIGESITQFTPVDKI